MAEAAKPRRAARIAAALDRAAGRRWFLPATAAFPLADYVLPVLPNQMLLIGLSMLQPRLWWRLALVFVLAGGTGAMLVATGVQAVGPALVEMLGGAPSDGAAAQLLDRVRRHALWALAALALLPPTPRSAVILCAVAGLPPLGIGAAVAAGRTLPVGALALIGAVAPAQLRRLSSVDRLLREIEALKAAPPR